MVHPLTGFDSGNLPGCQTPNDCISIAIEFASLVAKQDSFDLSDDVDDLRARSKQAVSQQTLV